MKAALLKDYGGENAVIVGEAERPEPSANEVQVEVHAASVNPFDNKVREGVMKDSIPINFPLILGGDVAGVVTALGEGVAEFSIGDQVYGQANALKQGSLAECTVVSISQLGLKPDVDYVTAAALPLVSASALQALNKHIKLSKDQKILIHGGAGGIGSIAIQIAKDIGAHVATTVSATDKEYASELGADVVIDYQTEDFTELVKDYDAVFDTVGGETFKKSYEVLRPGGKIVSMAAEADHELDAKYDVTSTHQFTRVTTEVLNKITELVNKGKIKVNIDKVFSLDQAPQALEYLKTGHPRGKVVVEVKS